LIGKADEQLVHQREKPLAEPHAIAFGFDQPSRFRMNGETSYGIVEYMSAGGGRRCGIPRTEMSG
jgi:hypothetical protein